MTTAPTAAINRAFRYRLYPTPDQAAQLGNITGACRYIYNLALEQRRDWWRQYRAQTGYNLSYFSQSAELTDLRKHVEWLRDVPRDAMDAALRDVDRAFQRFFAGATAYPNYRKRSDGCGFSVRAREVPVARINAKWARARIPKVGWVRLRLTRDIAGDGKVVTIREDALGWWISIITAIDRKAPATPAAAVGIDRGVAQAFAMSTGEMLRLPTAVANVDRQRKRAQRTLARREMGSLRRAKARHRVALLHARVRRMRDDWLHRTSTDITRRFGLVAIEALNIKNMTASAAGTLEEPGCGVAQKRGLNRAILSQGWGQFEQMLVYKLEVTGGALIRVPAAYSSQTCQACGAVDRRSRESQAVFRCVHCGHEDHADINAAKEILRRSTSDLLVEGARRRPVEARTTGEAA